MSRRASSSRSYSDRTLKILWGRAAGRCAAPDCRIELLADATDHDPIVVIGDIAHIKAASDKGPRADIPKAARDRDEYDNLILLCKNCHAKLDGQKNTNTVEYIRHLKTDHEAWVRESLPERGRGTLGWTVLVLQGQHPIDVHDCIKALSPDYVNGDPIILDATARDGGWEDLYRTLATTVDEIWLQTDPFECRLAVFPLAPVSACIALGYLVTSRPHVRLFQHHRDVPSWAWGHVPFDPDDITVEGLPVEPVLDDGEIAICFDISATVRCDQVELVIGNTLTTVHVAVPNPSTSWLQNPAQLDRLGRIARETFEAIIALCPNARTWHLFFAGPAPGAVRVGQQINPTMTPPVCLYEYRAQRRPRHQHSLCLGGPDNG